MHVIISYDITDDHKRQKLFKYLRNIGLHSQKSFFECNMSHKNIKSLSNFVNSLELEGSDSVLVYHLCSKCSKNSYILGQGTKFEANDWEII